MIITRILARASAAAALAIALPAALAAGKAPPVVEGTRTDAKEIAAILASIPATAEPDKTLADRLLRLNLDVRSVNVGRFTADDVKQDPVNLRKGDVDYLFSMTQPGDRITKECAIVQTFTFTRRGHLWLPTNKTANYLANGPKHCKAP